MFGQNTLTVLDHEPEQLLAVSGISKTKLKKDVYKRQDLASGSADSNGAFAFGDINPNGSYFDFAHRQSSNKIWFNR